MSLGARATKGGAKGKDRHAQDKGKSDKPQPKEKVKPQATTEQLRMANMIDRKSDDTADVRKMVQDLMEMTCRTEEEVCSALHDADNDVMLACNILLEAEPQQTGEWQTSEKKKKKPPAATNNGEAEPPRERSRSGPRPRRGAEERGDGGRGRGGRGSRGGRGGGRGGARGGRAPPRRAPTDHAHNDANPMGDTFPATEDWDNEEWSGSLSDTKVFTPSVNPSTTIEGETAPPRPAEDWEAETGAEHIPTYTYHNPTAHHANIEPPLPPAAAPAGGGYHQPMGMSGSLSAAQSHYLTQLTQQLHHPLDKHTPHSVYSSNYGVYTSTDIASQRKPQRARVPPPSKIPVSAVEMPGGACAETQFLDVQFGCGDDTLDTNKQPAPAPAAAPPAPAPEPPAPPRDEPPALDPHPHPHPHTHSHQDTNTHQPASYTTANNILNESLSTSESTAPSQPVSTEPAVVTNATSSLEKQLTASMKQLSVTEPAPHSLPQHRPAKSVTSSGGSGTAAGGGGAVNMYSHHPVSHHVPALYSTNVYPQQVNSSVASLTALPTPYPSSVVTQYQPIINSYQTSAAGVNAGYNSAALYTAAAPYTAYPSVQANKQINNTQYESNAVASSNSLTSTSTTQTSTAKVTTTTGHGGAVSSASSTAYGGALYGASQQYAAYDDQMLRGAMHHMGGYYEVTGYGVGVGGPAREAAFSLSASERFSRSDASSPQQVPTPTLPPGYAYYAYQPPPPTTYQYGVYPQFGAGSTVGGGGKVASYSQQQQYEQQDSYKPVSGSGVATYGAGGNKAGGAPDLQPAIYPKQHVALNKVNSYEKAGFHSGTPPPFGAASHLYIAAPHHHHHAPQHQESASSGGRSNSSKSTHSKPSYQHSYWPPN